MGLLRFPVQLFRINILWLVLATKLIFLYFVFDTSIALRGAVYVSLIIYCAVIGFSGRVGDSKNENSRIYIFAIILIVIINSPPVGQELDRLRLWLKFAQKKEAYESALKEVPFGSDGLKRNKWSWGSNGGDEFILLYDESNHPVVYSNSNNSQSYACEEFPVNITGNFYFVKISCAGIL